MSFPSADNSFHDKKNVNKKNLSHFFFKKKKEKNFHYFFIWKIIPFRISQNPRVNFPRTIQLTSQMKIIQPSLQKKPQCFVLFVSILIN